MKKIFPIYQPALFFSTTFIYGMNFSQKVCMSSAANRKIEKPLTRTLQVIRKPREYENLKIARLGKDLNKRNDVCQFKDWILPEQPTGYIKAKKNEIL